MKNILLLIISLILSTPVLLGQSVTTHISYKNLASNANGDTIYYKPGVQLAWADFKGTPDPHSGAGAITASGFSFHSQLHRQGNKTSLTLEVYAYFIKSRSWKKPGAQSAYHLTHEQHHLDITYLGALNLIKRLRQAKFTTKNYRAVILQIFEEANRENENMQHQYDRETQHSIHTSQQEIWNEKVRKMLKEATNQLNLED